MEFILGLQIVFIKIEANKSWIKKIDGLALCRFLEFECIRLYWISDGWLSFYQRITCLKTKAHAKTKEHVEW